MKSTKKRPVGRPLKGQRKRVRASFTIDPKVLANLKRYAKQQKTSTSSIIENSLPAMGNHTSDGAQVLGNYIKLRIGLEGILKKYHVETLSVFGSTLHGTANAESDIDLLVEFESDNFPSLFDLTSLEMELSKVFPKRKVDLKTKNDLSRYFREEVVKEAVPIYVKES